MRSASRWRLELDQHPGGDGLGQLGDRLARPGEADRVAGQGCVQGQPHLRPGGDVERVDDLLRCWTSAGIGLALTA